MATLEQQISQAEKEIAELSDKMEAARVDIVAAAADFAAGWWQAEAKRALQSHPERAAELHDDGLGFLKADIDSLVSGAEEAAEHVLSDPALWPHLGNPQSRPWQNPAVGRAIDPALRRLLGRVLPVLIRHRLRFPDRNGRPVTDRYPQGVEVPEALAEAARSYHGLAAELRPAAARLADLQQRQAAAAVDAEWKKA
jgi:hypothetical protein